jgi:hypothetical protein
MRECVIEDCSAPVKTRGYCSKHYQRVLAHGSPDVVLKHHSPNGSARKFLEAALTSDTDDCILWPFAKSREGYGVIDIGDKQYKAHRLVLLRTTGVEDDPLVLATHGPCHQRSCVNPRHLSWGSTSTNAADRRRDGTNLGGEESPVAKLSDSQVREIRDRYNAGGILQRELAIEFDCSQQQVSNIVTGLQRPGV